MPDRLTIDMVLAALLVTSFTCVGLLALWAATSPRHWFLRAAVVIALLSPLLLIPAHEPFLVFLLQAGVVVSGTRLWRWRSESRAVATSPISSEALHSGRSSISQFSLLTLLWLIAVVAIATAIGARVVKHMPPQNLEAWTTILLNGVLGGIAVLLGGWMVASKRKRLAWPAAVVLCTLMGAIFTWNDWFVVSIWQQQWPPNAAYWQAWQQPRWQRAANLWRIFYFGAGTMHATSLAVCVLVLLWRFAMTREPSVDAAEMFTRKRRGLSRFVARMGFALLVLLTAIVPGFVFLKLLNPLPVPHVSLPEPNGWDDLVAAGKTIDAGSPILNTSIEPGSTDELAAEIAKFASAYDQIRLALTRPCLVPVWPAHRNFGSRGFSFLLEHVQSVRTASRALSREAELAQQQGRFGDAANIAIENIRVGQASTRGGLLIHYLVGIAIEGIGQSALYPAIAHLDADSCRAVIAALEQAEQAREPLDEVFERDRIWSENAFGWHGHLVVLLNADRSYDDAYNSFVHRVRPRAQAISRLLMVELALRQYQLVHDAWPDTLDELVPQYLREAPGDPFDAEGRPLRYRRSVEGYLLYSVGFDGRDDGGRPPAENENGYVEPFGDGDLRLDVWFAPEEDRTVDFEDDEGQ